MNTVPLTSHPSASVAVRAKLIASAGGVTITARCPNGFRAEVMGHDEPTYTVHVTTFGATCSCVATRMCAHIGAAGLTAVHAERGEHEGADCGICGRRDFEALMARMSRS